VRRIVQLGLLAAACAFGQIRIPVLVGPGASPLDRKAADELRTYLAKVYPDCVFPLAQTAPGPGPRIRIGGNRRVSGESYSVSRIVNTVRIGGGDPRGTLYAVYALL